MHHLHTPLLLRVTTLVAVTLLSLAPGCDSGSDPMVESDASSASLCQRYGGAANVGGVVADYVVPELLGDCRVQSRFAALGEAGQTHLVQCLQIQVQEVFGCDGVQYAGATDANGGACRSMTAAHAGLGISDGDFDAVIEDIVAGMQAAGVAQADIDAVAPTVLGLRDPIVEVSSDALTEATCTP
ncbi:MAG: hypothetical protein R3B40_05950 [Polyangiales bacterium]|nr:hypothetical protein [Myxococcales bacterium]MCB9657480.1 hypothetical protein [Sandaracinaceae bacterium]